MLLDASYPLLPQRCAVCGQPASAVCAGCLAALLRVAPPLCERCGSPGHWPVRRCAECAGRRLAFAAARAALVYDERARALVGAWKERGVATSSTLRRSSSSKPCRLRPRSRRSRSSRRRRPAARRGHRRRVRSPKPSASAGPFRSPTFSAAPGDCRLSAACRSPSGGVTCAARSSREGRVASACLPGRRRLHDGRDCQRVRVRAAPRRRAVGQVVSLARAVR